MSNVIDINFLYGLYYKDNPELLRIILIHSELVAKKALSIIDKSSLQIDREFVYCGSLLHDIGVIRCYAPDIHAFGKKPYICHGVEGKKILLRHRLFSLARVCECHTGAGITASQIKENKLPLPPHDMLPISLEEKLICYADKFFSKGKDITREKNIDEIYNQMKKFGPESLARFNNLHDIFK